MAIVAPVPAYACANSHRCDMRTRADAMPIKAAASTDRSNVCAGFHAAITNACTGTYN